MLLYVNFFKSGDDSEESKLAVMHLATVPRIGEHMIFHGKRYKIADVDYCTDGDDLRELSRVNIELLECT